MMIELWCPSRSTSSLSGRPDMRILVALTYYRPHVSGLTIYAERIAHGLVGEGHDVTVLTSRYDRWLPITEVRDGVRVVRVPVAARISRGVVLPTFGTTARLLAADHDVVNVHLPQFDGWRAVRAARRAGRPVVATVHCQLQLQGGALGRVAGAVTEGADRLCLRGVDRVLVYTDDYAQHASSLRPHRAKTDAVLPPIVMPEPDPDAVAALRSVHGLDGDDLPTIGLACRFSHEKGVEVLLDAVELLERRGRPVRVLFAGPWGDVVGERGYWRRLEPRVTAMGDRWRFAGTLGAGAEMAAFYGAIDCLAVCSVNSTEAFGLVQVEAMLCGAPVVSCDLPGVRQPVLLTGMGELARTGDAASFADGLEAVLEKRSSYVRPRAEIAARFDVADTVRRYADVLTAAVERRPTSNP